MALVSLLSCSNRDNGFSSHSSGLEYKFIASNPSGDSPGVGDIVVLSIKYFDEQNTLLDESDFYRMQVSRPAYQGDIHTGLQMLQVGDSVCFRLDALDFYEKTRKRELPQELQQGDPLYIHLRLKNILSAKSLETERQGIYHTDEKQEMQLLEDYLERTNIRVEPLESGLRIVILEEGGGLKPMAGQTVTVHYTGKTIDGKIFDTSLTKPRPLSFILGRGEVIKGWDEGFLHLTQGSKARLIIPSKLAYGDQGYGNAILPYSTLVFDVELINIK